MTQKRPKKSKAESPTMVLKSFKEIDYIYILSNGKSISFSTKEFPNQLQSQSNQNQLTLF